MGRIKVSQLKNYFKEFQMVLKLKSGSNIKNLLHSLIACIYREIN